MGTEEEAQDEEVEELTKSKTDMSKNSPRPTIRPGNDNSKSTTTSTMDGKSKCLKRMSFINPQTQRQTDLGVVRMYYTIHHLRFLLLHGDVIKEFLYRTPINR